MTQKDWFDKRFNDFKKDIEINYSNEYEFVDFYFIINNTNGRNKGMVKVRHKFCGNEFSRVGSAWKQNKNCQYCSKMLQVSRLHSVVSLVAKELYPNSVNGYDIGFKGKRGGISKYDLYIPALNGKNTLIEFQSRYHDSSIEHDENKRTFAITNGYAFLSCDSRTDSIKSVLNSLFKLDSIPDSIQDVDSQYYKHDFLLCQQYLDKNLTVREISKLTNISMSIIHHGINNGTLVYKKDRKEKIYNKSPVVQLTLSGEFIQEYESAYYVYKNLKHNISSCVNGKAKQCDGFLWVKKAKYLNGDYIIPKRIRMNNKILINHIEE